MPRKQGNIGSLLQGVSQQSFSTRLAGYHEEQKNFIPDITKGLTKRPPVESIATLTSNLDPNAKLHYIKKDNSIQYILVITNGDIKVFNLLGVEQTLSINNAVYLASTNIKEDISLATIGDYTIINNKQITPETTGTLTVPDEQGEAIVYIKRGEFNIDYTLVFTIPVVTLTFNSEVFGLPMFSSFIESAGAGTGEGRLHDYDNTTFTLRLYNYGSKLTLGNFILGEPVSVDTQVQTAVITSIDTSDSITISVTQSTPDGSSAGHGADIQVDNIAQALSDSINASVNLDFVGFSGRTDNTNIIWIQSSHSLGIRPSITVRDDNSSGLMRLMTNSINSKDELPSNYIHSRQVKISPNSMSTVDDFYMEYDNTEYPTTINNNGVWKETTADNIKTEIDPLLAPQVLVRLNDGTFYFGPLNGTIVGGTTIESWTTRQVGSDTTNPMPIWIGKTIEHIDVFQQRLIILCDEYISTSKTSEFFNFFRTTATEIIDSDPIEISPVGSGINLMKQTVNQEKDLIIFSDNAQYIIKGDVALTPSTVALTVLSTYSSDIRSELLSTGDSVLFPVKNNKYTGVKELFISKTSNVRSAHDLTTIVPEFISGDITRSKVDTKLGLVLYQTNELKTLYCWKYLNSNNKRVQGAWFEFNFNIDIIDFEFYEEGLLILSKDSNVYLSTLDFNNPDVAGMNYNVYIDHREVFTSVNTVFTCEQDIDSTTIVIQGSGCPNAGYTVEYTNAGNTVTLEDDMQGGTVYIGKKYSASFKPTAPRQFDQNQLAVSRGRLVCNTYNIDFEDSVRFNTTSISKGNTYTKEYEGYIAGESLIGNPDISSGTFKVAIKEKNSDMRFSITSDTHFPVRITNIDYEGQYSPNARR